MLRWKIWSVFSLRTMIHDIDLTEWKKSKSRWWMYKGIQHRYLIMEEVSNGITPITIAFLWETVTACQSEVINDCSLFLNILKIWWGFDRFWSEEQSISFPLSHRTIRFSGEKLSCLSIWISLSLSDLHSAGFLLPDYPSWLSLPRTGKIIMKVYGTNHTVASFKARQGAGALGDVWSLFPPPE